MKRDLAALPALVGGFVFAALAGSAHAGTAASPIVKGPWTQHVGQTSAVVRVEVSPPSPITLVIDGVDADDAGAADSGSRSRTIEDSDVRALHSIAVTNLAPGRRYAFRVRAHGAERFGALTTAPADGDAAPFHFLVYGDNRTDDLAHGAVVQAMLKVPTPFVVQTGDLVDNGGKAVEWQRFFDIEAPLLRERGMLSAVGNHELVDGAGIEYVRYFGPAEDPESKAEPTKLTLEELSGTARWGNTRFFLVNGMVDYDSGPTRAWMDKALTEADGEPGLVWRIIVVHHGPRSSGPHGDNAHFNDAHIPDLWQRHHIDLVLSGHDHEYERGKFGALPYLVSGGGGAPLYRVKKAESSSERYESVHHFVDIGVTGTAIEARAIRVDGSTIEHCVLKKASDWACDDAPASPGSPDAKNGAPKLAADEPVVTRSKCGCDVVGARDAGVLKATTLLSALLASLAISRRRRRTDR